MSISRVMWVRMRAGVGLLVAVALALFAAGCGDVYRPVAVPIAGPPGDPQQSHLAFVVSDNAPSNAGSVLHLNVSGDSATFETPLGVGPVHAAFLPPGESRIYLANRDSDTVTTCIPFFTTVTPVDVRIPSTPGVPAKPVF